MHNLSIGGNVAIGGNTTITGDILISGDTLTLNGLKFISTGDTLRLTGAKSIFISGNARLNQLYVNSTTLVTNLNADRLDSAHIYTHGKLGDSTSSIATDDTRVHKITADTTIASIKAVTQYADSRMAHAVRYSKTSHQTIAGSFQAKGGIRHSNADTQPIILKRRINIGDWNMLTTQSITLTHGLTKANILAATVTILRDDGNIYPFCWATCTSTTTYAASFGGTWNMGDTYITLDRGQTGQGYFYSASFDSTSFNRGYIILDYTT